MSGKLYSEMTEAELLEGLRYNINSYKINTVLQTKHEQELGVLIMEREKTAEEIVAIMTHLKIQDLPRGL